MICKLPFPGVLTGTAFIKKNRLAAGFFMVGAERFELPTLSV